MFSPQRHLLLLATCGAVLTGSRLHASTVSAAAEISSGFSYKADPALANSNGTIAGNTPLKSAVTTGNDLLAGNLVLIGAFNLTDAQIQANATNVSFLTQPANFATFGALHIGDNYPTKPGWFSGTVTNNTTTLGIAGKQIYMFVIAATDNSTMSQSIATAFQIGIFYENVASWKFRAENAVPNSTSIDLSDLTASQDGMMRTGTSQVIVGTFGPDKSNNDTTATNFGLASVPEPSSGLLALLTSAGWLALRRRRGNRASTNSALS